VRLTPVLAMPTKQPDRAVSKGPLKNVNSQERAQGYPEQAQTGGTTVLPLGFSETDTDRLATMPPQGETPARIETDQGC
jgi:hypothetical protein